MNILVDYKTGGLLERLRPQPWHNLGSIIRFLVTAAIDGRRGFTGRGYLLLGEAHPMPYETAKEIYLDVLHLMNGLDEQVLERFFIASEDDFKGNGNRSVHYLAKTPKSLYENKQRSGKSYEKVGKFFIVTHGAPEAFESRLRMMMESNGFGVDDLTVFWK